MKEYETPVIEIITVKEDVIASSSEGYIQFWRNQVNA